jgi:hypothetical protein
MAVDRMMSRLAADPSELSVKLSDSGVFEHDWLPLTGILTA